MIYLCKLAKIWPFNKEIECAQEATPPPPPTGSALKTICPLPQGAGGAGGGGGWGGVGIMRINWPKLASLTKKNLILQLF